MKADEKDLRAAYRGSTGAPHVDDATWERLGAGTLDARGRAAVADHVVRCARCAAIWRGVDALRAAAGVVDPVTLLSPRRLLLRRSLYALSALAAAAAVLLFVSRWRSPSSTEEGETLRGEAPGTIEVVGAGSAPARFDWRPIEHAASYRVRVFAADGTPVWTSDVVAAPPVAGPPALPPGSYRWRVEALDAGRSRLVPFEIGK